VTHLVEEELEGNTLSVYAYLVKEGKPVGTRDVTRGANLSSTSVAYRHLQKLEALGLIQKNEYDDYTVKAKAAVKGHLWLGRNLVPRSLFYSFFFMGALIAEVSSIVATLVAGGPPPDATFIYLVIITAVAMTLFLIEGLATRT
jgi:hypothetical protein